MTFENTFSSMVRALEELCQLGEIKKYQEQLKLFLENSSRLKNYSLLNKVQFDNVFTKDIEIALLIAMVEKSAHENNHSDLIDAYLKLFDLFFRHKLYLTKTEIWDQVISALDKNRDPVQKLLSKEIKVLQSVLMSINLNIAIPAKKNIQSIIELSLFAKERKSIPDIVYLCAMRVGQAEILTAAEELYRFTRDKSSSNNLISYIRGLNRKPRKFFDVVVKEIIVSEDDNHQAEEMIIDQPEELEPSYTGSFIHASDDESEYDEITGDILMKEYEKALIKAGGLDDENFKNFIERYIEKLKDEN